jgi:hypothetical protein
MNIGRRLERLEGAMLIAELNPQLELELSAWFKIHPNYVPGIDAQGNEGVEMPDYLVEAFFCRAKYMMKKKNLIPHLCSLLDIWEEVRY